MEKNKLPSFINLGILTAITAVSWVFFDVYRFFRKETPPVVPPEISAKFDPQLDVETLYNVYKRVDLDESNIVYTPTPIPTETPTATVSPSPTASASASASPLPTPTSPAE